jgi:hypothetical protein
MLVAVIVVNHQGKPKLWEKTASMMTKPVKEEKSKQRTRKGQRKTLLSQSY